MKEIRRRCRQPFPGSETLWRSVLPVVALGLLRAGSVDASPAGLTADPFLGYRWADTYDTATQFGYPYTPLKIELTGEMTVAGYPIDYTYDANTRRVTWSGQTINGNVTSADFVLSVTDERRRLSGSIRPRSQDGWVSYTGVGEEAILPPVCGFDGGVFDELPDEDELCSSGFPDELSGFGPDGTAGWFWRCNNSAYVDSVDCGILLTATCGAASEASHWWPPTSELCSPNASPVDEDGNPVIAAPETADGTFQWYCQHLFDSSIMLACDAERPTATVQVAAGAKHSCAVDSGAVMCWGNDARGQASPPTALGPVRQVTGGRFHSCALDTTGVVRCWGDDAQGQSSPPSDLGDVVQVTAGDGHTCALDSVGTVTCWGSNIVGQTAVPAFAHPIAQVNAGPLHNCAVDVNGRIRCWGVDVDGQASPPSASRTGSVQVAAAYQHSCATDETGDVSCWGDDRFGQANPPADLGLAHAVTAGLFYTCALHGEGNVTCWGDDRQGAASPPSDLGPVVQVDSGDAHTCAVDVSNRVVCWGSDDLGQATPPSTLTSTAAGPQP